MALVYEEPKPEVELPLDDVPLLVENVRVAEEVPLPVECVWWVGVAELWVPV